MVSPPFPDRRAFEAPAERRGERPEPHFFGKGRTLMTVPHLAHFVTIIPSNTCASFSVLLHFGQADMFYPPFRQRAARGSQGRGPRACPYRSSFSSSSFTMSSKSSPKNSRIAWACSSTARKALSLSGASGSNPIASQKSSKLPSLS